MQTQSTTHPGPYSTYYGGKAGAGVAQTIINHIRPHDVYMELFLGNCAVFRAKKPALDNTINDLDITVWSGWIDHRKAGHVPANTTITSVDAIDFLAGYPFLTQLRYCIYLDPPYPIHSRRAGREQYACEMRDDDHRQLLKVIRYLPDNVDVLISTYENSIYAKLLADWHLVTFQAQTRQGMATEYLYMNYVPDGRLHDYRYLGQNRTDRQRIRRKIAREVARLNRLPVIERNAIVAAVLASVATTDYPAEQTVLSTEYGESSQC